MIEDETRFRFYCNLREYLYEKIHPEYQHFEILPDSVFAKHTEEYLYKAYYKKCSVINN